VILQSYRDKFKLPDRKYKTPAVAGDVLTKCEDKDVMDPEDQTIYRSGVGKMMHVMQYSRPETYNAVRDLARHFTRAGQKHMDAMLRAMKYSADRPNRGLILRPDTKWNGKKGFKFTISGRSDSDYAKEPVDRRSVSGSRVLLNGAPVMFKSSTQKHVALSVTEAELYAAVSCAQDMLYVMNVLESVELEVELPMILEVDNKGAVGLANNWSIGGRTRHIDVRQCFLRELKEKGILIVKWIAGDKNDSDIHTKNLDGPKFEEFGQVYYGKDEYTPASE
jgi:hypothetical protein